MQFPPYFRHLRLMLLGSLCVMWPGTRPALAASVSTTLFVQIRPEAALSRQGEDTILLKIRLAPGARAMIWSASTCGEPEPGSYIVSRSGIYALPLSIIPGPSNAGICVASSDGAFALFLDAIAPAR